MLFVVGVLNLEVQNGGILALHFVLVCRVLSFNLLKILLHLVSIAHQSNYVVKLSFGLLVQPFNLTGESRHGILGNRLIIDGVEFIFGQTTLIKFKSLVITVKFLVFLLISLVARVQNFNLTGLVILVVFQFEIRVIQFFSFGSQSNIN